VLTNAVILIFRANSPHNCGDTRSSTSRFGSTFEGCCTIYVATYDAAYTESLEVRSVAGGECYP